MTVELLCLLVSMALQKGSYKEILSWTRSVCSRTFVLLLPQFSDLRVGLLDAVGFFDAEDEVGLCPPPAPLDVGFVLELMELALFALSVRDVALDFVCDFEAVLVGFVDDWDLDWFIGQEPSLFCCPLLKIWVGRASQLTSMGLLLSTKMRHAAFLYS